MWVMFQFLWDEFGFKLAGLAVPDSLVQWVCLPLSPQLLCNSSANPAAGMQGGSVIGVQLRQQLVQPVTSHSVGLRQANAHAHRLNV